MRNIRFWECLFRASCYCGMNSTNYDAIIIGSGMGGMSAAALLANDGYRVLVLEAALHPGGCSSSYPRKGFVFESGATTLIGFDEHQPLRFLEEKTGIRIPREELKPSMNVTLNGKQITRFKDRHAWLEEVVRVFGNRKGQLRFWKLAQDLAEVVWRVSLRNPFFPPQSFGDWWSLLTSNNPADVWVLRYARKSVKQVAEKCGVATPEFLRFLDEQLMITAQSKAADTPFLFGAAGITYTNYSNYYVPGGLIKMIDAIREFITQKGGAFHTKEAVLSIKQIGDCYQVHTKKEKTYEAPVVISNVPVWNMPDLTGGEMQSYFKKESGQYSEAWGAVTMGIAASDAFPESLPLHHQLNLPEGETVPFTPSKSVFVSLSKQGDTERAPEGYRSLNVSCHAKPEDWFAMGDAYNDNKETVHKYLLDTLTKLLPGFADAEIKFADVATPVSWEQWVSRKKGRVGGIPQSMARSLLNWTPNQTPFKGLYLVGDTTYPGQGIPGVTLGGINVYSRVKKYHPK